MQSAQASDILAIGVLAGLGAVLTGWVILRIRRWPLLPVQTILYAMNYLLVRVRWRANVVGRIEVPPGQGAVIVCNHRCPADPSFIQTTTARPVHWMVAEEYCRLPVLSWFLRTCEIIPVRRGATDMAATRRAIRLAQEGGLVGIFPEGRLNTTDEVLLPGRSGAAMIAMRAGVPVIPCYIDGSPFDGSILGCLFMPAKVTLTIGRPIDLSDATNREGNRAALDELTRQLLYKIAKLGGHPDFQPTSVTRSRSRRRT